MARRPDRIVVLTGAGLSAESGIATFRDAGGLWEQHRVEDVATPEGFAADPALADAYRGRFNTVLEFVSRNFPIGFRKTAKGTATPRARFEAIAVGSERALSERPELKDASAEEIGVSSWIDGADFQKVTSSDGANAIARLNGRIDFVKDKLVKHGDD